MAKAYWVSTYWKILDAEKLAAYSKLARPAVETHGGRFIARGMAAHAYEQGVKERTVLVEFPSLEAAVEAHDSAAYKEALAALAGGVERDLRIVEGV